MVVIATRDVAARFRGFLSSVMVEIGPGVYTGPQMSAGVRERVWSVLDGWFKELGGGSVVMIWGEARLPCGQGLRYLGEPPKEFVEVDGLITVRREAPNSVR